MFGALQKKTEKLEELNVYLDYEILENVKSRNIVSLIKKLKEINLLPFSNEKMYFNSDVWDFTKFIKSNVVNSEFKFYFKNAPKQFRDIIKIYVLMKLFEDNLKIQSIKDLVYAVMRFFKYVDDCGINEINEINHLLIKKYLNNLNVSNRTLRKNRTAIRDFYKNYSLNFYNIRTPKIDKVLANNDHSKIKMEIKENKTSNIPDNYFNKFLQLCIKVAKDNNEEDFIRGIASIYLILSQTGLRIGECLDLRMDSLKTVERHNGSKMNFLLYRTWKRVRKVNNVDYAHTYVNKITLLGINTLKKLKTYESARKMYNINYLYLGSKYLKNKKSFPINTETFRRHSVTFFIKFDSELNTLNLPENYYPGISNKRLHKTTGKYKDIKTIAMPSTVQFRVRVVTELIEKGVHINYVQKFMGHLTSEMTLHYAEPKESLATKQEEAERAKSTLKSIITGKEKLLGKNSNRLIKDIEKFIEKNRYNVVRDLDEIIEKMTDIYPIKQKAGGYLVAPFKRKRDRADLSSEMYFDKYGFETSGLTFYYMFDNTFKQVSNLARIINWNINNGFSSDANRELKKLKKSINDLLEPELIELKKQLEIKGEDSVLKQHPNLIEVVSNIEHIEREIEKWKNIMI